MGLNPKIILYFCNKNGLFYLCLVVKIFASFADCKTNDNMMKRHLTIFCLLVMALNLQARQGNNMNKDLPFNPFGHPLIPDMVAGPSVVEINGMFYCYVTTDGYGQGREHRNAQADIRR